MLAVLSNTMHTIDIVLPQVRSASYLFESRFMLFHVRYLELESTALVQRSLAFCVCVSLNCRQIVARSLFRFGLLF